ncbi:MULTISPECIES: hypothetical protein [Roseateles]|jgi:hypothetical protein|uniref:Uncharacterized protein n=1 Tax=Roseateles albus TaxID=2987525 RepID=A0ABT5KD94_9BURK|nr:MULTISPECIES: hypothetical protein [Roseateles]MCV2357286.1 hypothetical protein [Paucibacter sp. B2R-40]MCV2360434.1 hypothetical protein [Paucibacter sp. TC2R-5]MDC8771891.1 hypothetical protein [Roseateles albus]
MKIYQIEVQKFKAASNNIHGQVLFKVDALINPKAEVEGIEPSTIIALTEKNARVLMALLKAQLAEFDGKKARSRF